MPKTIATAKPAPAFAPALMSDTTLAAYLDISERACWMLAASGKLPQPIRLPGMRATRWRREDVDRAIEEWAEEATAAPRRVG